MRRRRKLAIVSGGVAEPSSTRLLADRLATAAHRALGELDVETEVEVLNLRDHAQGVTNMLLTGFADERLGAAIKEVVESDGLIAVTPIFNASYSGLFKTFFDVLEHGSLVGKPVLIAATAGSPRHSLALEHAIRPLFSYMRAIVLPTAVFAASEDWGSGITAEQALSERIDRAAGELARLVAAEERPNRVDRYEDVTPLENLLDS